MRKSEIATLAKVTVQTDLKSNFKILEATSEIANNCLVAIGLLSMKSNKAIVGLVLKEALAECPLKTTSQSCCDCASDFSGKQETISFTCTWADLIWHRSFREFV